MFASQLHTHLTGLAVRTEHVRADGTQLPDLNRDEHYSTHYQEIRLLPQQRALMPVSVQYRPDTGGHAEPVPGTVPP